MTEEENLELVQRLEAADFRSKTFMDALADDIEWWVAGPPAVLPWAGTFRGREGVLNFVESLMGHLRYQKWEPYEWIAKGDTVIEFTHAGGYAKATGHTYESDIVHVWKLHQGKVVGVRSYYDTAAYASALHGAP